MVDLFLLTGGIKLFNRDGVKRVAGLAPKQILANVEMQASVGCVVSQSVGVDVDGKKIAKAGMPIVVDFSDRTIPAATESDASPAAVETSISGQGILTAEVTDIDDFGNKVSHVSGRYVFYCMSMHGDGSQAVFTVYFNNETFDTNVDLDALLANYGLTVTVGGAASNPQFVVNYTAAKPATTANAVLLHDVDVTDGDANGAALYFGTVNINRLDDDVQQLVQPGVAVIGDVSFIYG